VQLTFEDRSHYSSVTALQLLLLLALAVLECEWKKKNKPFSYMCNSHRSLKECGHIAAKLLFGKLDSSVPSLLRKTDNFSLFSGFKIHWEKLEVLPISRFCPRKSALISARLFLYCQNLVKCSGI